MSAMTMQASYTIGEAFEFKVITAAVLGGVSLNGGRGTIAPGYNAWCAYPCVYIKSACAFKSKYVLI